MGVEKSKPARNQLEEYEGWAHAGENRAAAMRNAMNFLPTVVRAKYVDNYRIQVTFNDGTSGTVDFIDWLEGPVFQPLLDVSYFQRFFLDGGTVSWPNGADIAPETLYEAAVTRKRPITTLQPPSRARRKVKTTKKTTKDVHASRR